MAEYLDKDPTGGTTLGQSATALVSFYGADPVDQPATTAAVSTSVPTQTSPFGFATSAQMVDLINLVNQLRADLIELGLKASA